ncbi:MAG: EF-P beta-lysylation protein EpmB [Gammaproteobacteria bacterium]|nr:EF-P beta-lysylation protein EpmB [Gammaproteobacteria bacterium]
MQVTNKPWQVALSEGFASSAALLEFLGLPVKEASAGAEQIFKTRVPRGFAENMERGNLNDPLLRQVLAVQDELALTPDFVEDPLNEAAYNPVSGLIHKYHGRVLLTVTGVCAINCRYCFRRHFPYDDNNPGRAGWQAALDYIAADNTIHEVILSGGDPLLATDATLRFLFEALESIKHIHTVRIHTRLPVVLPERVDTGLCALLGASRFQTAVVLHANHPHELSVDVTRACAALRGAGCHLLNQSVLLQGVNHTAATLCALSERLWACGVLPYYLHLLDKVQGSAHFEVSAMHAKAVLKTMSEQLPGYLVPRLVREVPGEKHKCQII